MHHDEHVSPGFAHPFRQNIYNSSIASSASASSASVWSETFSHASDASSQTSDSSSQTSDDDSCDSYCAPSRTGSLAAPPRRVQQQPAPAATSVHPELRRHPRRTAASSSRRACPPSLVRQEDRKNSFVDNLVDSSTQIVEAIWPTSSAVCHGEPGRRDVLPLRMFIQETLRRSRTSYSTLQVALYYLVLIRPRVPARDFTTEQVDDRPSAQALQCGRRMFLAALILASKYLQDRNYSARAWSKISGLNTHEINQNEMAFLMAVNWKLHITDEVFRRWADIVLKHTPPSMPPSPGAAASQPAVSQKHETWRRIVLGLNAELTNLEELLCAPSAALKVDADVPARPTWPGSLSIVTSECPRAPQELFDASVFSKTHATPMVMEPTPTSAYTPGRLAPALSLLPTPRLTPQASGFCTPAAGAALLPPTGKVCGSMSMAMSQANSVATAQFLDRPPTSCSMSSPQSYCPVRRSSLANSVSTASSPESMISDTSRSSRSSSISSASSLASATTHSKLSAQSRFRAPKMCVERLSSKPTVPSVPEDSDEHHFQSSPDSYTGPVGKPYDWSVEAPLAGRKRPIDDLAGDAASDAAQTLQELHNRGGYADVASVSRMAGGPARMSAMDPLQDEVRDLLRGTTRGRTPWPSTLVRSRAFVSESNLQHQRLEVSERKRVCCATEAASAQPGLDLRGPGMWQGILN